MEMNTKQGGKNTCWKLRTKKLQKAECVASVALYAVAKDEHQIETEMLSWELLQGSAAVVTTISLLCIIVRLGATLLWVATTSMRADLPCSVVSADLS
jgi:hypothetical protein